jgi:sterol desaturase/sphingolipid hydroxylase (fatty acid hydroxylase superfamily)
MPDYRLIIAGIFVGFALLEGLAGSLLYRDKSKPKDIIIELVAGLTIPIFIVPFALFGAPHIIEFLGVGEKDALSSWPAWLMFGVLLLGDDLTQYWWHRMSHTWPWLYSFHRAHHSAEYMSVRIVYRNSLLYYAFMPGVWISAGLIYMGFGPVYVWYAIAKLSIITGAHSSVAWDQPLMRNRYTKPVIWILARIISTPTTHAAHHGKFRSDPATHYKGNFGNFLFFWDVLFGTAKISEQRPKEYGLEKVSSASWFQELIWPLGMRSSEYRQADRQ